MKNQILMTLALVILLNTGCSTPQENLTKTNQEPAETPTISIHQAAYKGDTATILQHHAAGTNIDLKNQWNATPLHYAARSGKLESAKTLVSVGANVNAKNNDNITPLHYAASRGSSTISLLLIKQKAYINEQDSEGLTPLHWAARGGHNELIDLLINNGASVNTKSEAGLTPLELADENSTETLRKHGAKSAVSLGILSEDFQEVLPIDQYLTILLLHPNQVYQFCPELLRL